MEPGPSGAGLFARPLPGFDDSCLVRALPLGREVARAPVVFRGDDEGFTVEELPAYLPSGEGEHLYLFIEKRGLSTPAFVKRLQERFRLDEREIGIAGRKDERGVTRQWLSVPARKVEPEVAAVSSLGVTLLEAKRHGNKLRLGHLRGNRFTVLLDAGDRADAFDVEALRERTPLVATGVPNLFGAQRFGAHDSTLRQAERFVERGRPARSRREEFWISAVQSSLFNAWLASRVDDGTWQTPLEGDVLEKALTGAPFVCTDPAADAPRVARGEVCVSGPLLGRAMRPSEREAMTRESRSWERLGIAADRLLAHPAFAAGARRAACLRPADLTVDVENSGRPRVSLRFSLPKGAYASVVLRALLGPALVDAAFLDGPLEGKSDISPPPAP